MGYHVSDANSYLVITGGQIDDIKIVKKAWVWAWQRFAKFSINPFDYELTLQAMTIEKLQFSLPVVFTIGPYDNPDALRKYAKLLTDQTTGKGQGLAPGRSHLKDIVNGIIEGETRVIVSGMTMEEIFKERQLFKTKVIENVQSELDQFGLKIYNANVKELQDTPGSEYFKFLSRKAHEGASNQAKIDVANARALGEIGEAEKKGKTRQEISKIDAQTAVLETQRKSEKATADAELTNTTTRLNMGIKLAEIGASRAAEAKDAELQRDVETKRAEMELEKRRATDLVKAKIERESAQEKAVAKLYADQKEADGKLYKSRQDADAANYRFVKEADAANYRAMKEAEAAFYSKKREAEAMSEMATAYGQMADVLGGPQGLLQYLMLQDHTYEKLAQANATAIQGLQPKITVWNTGDSAAADSGAPIRNLLQSLPPMLQTINEQTGIQPPTWLARMGGVSGSEEGAGKGRTKVNGIH